MFILAIITTLVFVMLSRSLLVVTGTYKDPLLASFETYGEEHFVNPLVGLTFWTAIFIYVFLYWYVSPGAMFLAGLIIWIPLGSFYGKIISILAKHKQKISQYPRWFYHLMQITDRDERRRIAYMWLCLPASTRMIYNANNHLFHQWVEQVLLTVAHSSAPVYADGVS